MNDEMLNIALILGSTRPGRNGEVVNECVYEIAKRRSDTNFELVDIKDFNLPLLDEPIPPSMGHIVKNTPRLGRPQETRPMGARIESRISLRDVSINIRPQ